MQCAWLIVMGLVQVVLEKLGDFSGEVVLPCKLYSQKKEEVCFE